MRRPLFAVLSFALCCQSAHAATRTYELTLHSGTNAPDGIEREVYMINGRQVGPLIEANQYDTLEVTVYNNLDVENTIHWHGLLQRGTPDMDGVPGVTQMPIPPGGNFTYRMPLGDQSGFYWYHSHFKTYYNDAIRGPLLIHPDPSLRRPFESLAENETERLAMRQAERDAMPVLLADWYHNLSSSVYQEYIRTGAYPNCVDSLLANGHGQVQCLPSDVVMAGTESELGSMSMSTGSSGTGPMAMSSSTMMKSMGMPEDPMQTMTMAGTMSVSMTMEHSPMSSGMISPRSQDSSASSNGMSSMAMGSSPSKSSGAVMGMSRLNARGCMPPMQFNPGYSIDDLPSVTCTNTSAPRLMIPAKVSSGWLSLHLVNAGATAKLRVSVDAHTMFVYAADGVFVQMQEVEVLPIGIGERYSVMIKLNQKPGQYYLRFAAYPLGDMQQVIEDQAIIRYEDSPGDHKPPIDANQIYHAQQGTWMFTNGSAQGDASVLEVAKLAPFVPNPPPSGAADATKVFSVNQTEPTVWVLDKARYVEANAPVVYGNTSDGWDAPTTLHMPTNASVDIIMQIAEKSMDKMGHPMHLHGHKFWILGTGSGQFPGQSVQEAASSILNLDNPPYRDTVELPPSGWAAIRYITDNPGAWLFHCHIQWHLVSGMALVLVEGDEQLPSLVRNRASSTKNSGPKQATGAARSGSNTITISCTMLAITAGLIVAGTVW